MMWRAGESSAPGSGSRCESKGRAFFRLAKIANRLGVDNPGGVLTGNRYEMERIGATNPIELDASWRASS